MKNSSKGHISDGHFISDNLSNLRVFSAAVAKYCLICTEPPRSITPAGLGRVAQLCLKHRLRAASRPSIFVE